MSTTRITLRNDFHRTEIAIRCRQVAGHYELTSRQATRVHKALCGARDCSCGYLGVRDPMVSDVRRYAELPPATRHKVVEAAGLTGLAMTMDDKDSREIERRWYVQIEGSDAR